MDIRRNEQIRTWELVTVLEGFSAFSFIDAEDGVSDLLRNFGT